jgi:hypothetical protein
LQEVIARDEESGQSHANFEHIIYLSDDVGKKGAAK